MEQRAAELQAREATVAAFGDLVNAMRGVAAARAQRARTLLQGADAYATTVADALAQALPLTAPHRLRSEARAGRPVLILFCAEQGFNGGFSEQVLAAATGAHEARVLLLGSQGLRLARARGIEPEWSAPSIAHAEAAVGASAGLHAALAQALARRLAPSVSIVAAELQDGHRYTIVRRRLLPLDLATMRRAQGPAPTVHLAPLRLIDELTFEYVAAQLAQALLHSHAAENVARLQAMAAAHDNVARMLETLQGDERRLRQAAITAEIIELAAGLRALHPQPVQS
jgi:F-type H+-transporting ATPase subunit gamma